VKIAGLGGKLGSFGSIVGTALGGLAIVGGGAIAALGVSSATAAADFESAMSSVAAVAGASDAELKALSDTAIKLGQDTTLSGVGATDAALAMRELAAAGMSTADIIGGGALGALRLASAGGIEVGRAAEIAAMALSQFGLAGSEAANVADLFAAAANSSAISVDDIAESMKYVGPVANSMGLSIEETTAAIAALGNQGIKGSAAGTALRSMIVSLASPSKEASKVITDLGLSMFDANGKMKSIAGISEELKTKMAGLTDQQRASALATLFGNEALSAATILYGEGGAGITSWIDKLENGATAAEVGAKRNNNLKGSVEALKSAYETAQIALGRGFLPVLKLGTDMLGAAVSATIPLITAFSERIPAAITAFQQTMSGAGTGGFGGILATAFLLISDSVEHRLIPAFNLLRAAFGGAGDEGAQVGPKLSLVERVILAVAQAFETGARGVQTFVDYIVTAKQAFDGAWSDSASLSGPIRLIGEAFTFIGDASRTLQGWMDKLPGPLGQAAAAFVAIGPALLIVKAALPALTSGLGAVVPVIRVLTSTLPLLGTIIGALGLPITLIVAAVALLAAAWIGNWGGIRDATMPVIQQIAAFVTGTLLPALAQFGTYLMTTVAPLFMQGWAMIQQAVSAALTAIMPYVQQFIGFLTGQLLPGIQGIIAVAAPAFQAMGAAVIGAFQAALPGIQAFIGGMASLGAAVLPIVMQVAGVIIDSLGPAVMAIVGWAQTVIPQFAAAFVTVWGIIGPVVGAIASFIGGALEAIAGFISAHSATIVAMLQGAWDIISGVIGVAFALITGIISTGLQLISGNWTGAWDTIKATAQTVWDGIKTIISGAWDLITGVITIALDAVKLLISGAWDAIKATATTAWDGVKTVVSDAWAKMTTAITTGVADAEKTMSGLPGKIASAVGDLGKLLFDKGADLVQGLINGINSKIAEAVGLAADLAGKVAGAITGLWKEHSPSRLAMEIGQHFVDGLIIGMDDRGDAAVFTASTIARDVAATVAGYTGTMQRIGRQVFGTLPESARIEGSTLATEINAQMAKAKATVDAFATRLYGSGVGLVTNIGAGWQESAPGVLALASGLGAEALAQFRKYDERAKDAGRQLFGNVQQGLQEVAPGISTMVSTLAADIARTTAQITTNLTSMTTQLYGGKDKAGDVKAAATKVTETLGDGLSVFQKLLPLKDIPKEVMAALGTAMDDALALVGGLVTQAKMFREDALDFLWNAEQAAAAIAKGLGILGSLQGYGGFDTSVPNVGTMTLDYGSIPQMAQGGIVTKPTLAMIGEGGQSEAVIPLSRLNSGGVNIYIQAPVYGVDHLEDVVVAAWESMDRRGRR